MKFRDLGAEVASRGHSTDLPRLLMQPLLVKGSQMLVNIQT